MTHRIGIFAVLVFCLLATAVTPPAVAERKKLPDELAGPWQLFIDDYLIAAKHNVQRRYHPFRKHPDNPLIVLDQPWEGTFWIDQEVVTYREGRKVQK